jgi:hypothetical protein
MATQRDKYDAMFKRFLAFAAESQMRYPELSALMEPLTKVSSLSVFLLFFKSADESAEILEICANADEEFQVAGVDGVVSKMLAEHELDPLKFDPKDRAKLVKYLRLFGDMSINGI